MPKYRDYMPPKKIVKEEKFFDFRDVQTRPWKWSKKTSNRYYEWSPQEIWEAEQRREKRKRIKEESK